MKNYNVFLCYRRAGAQTAKLFKHYLQQYPYYGSVWYSDEETYGNYRQDIKRLIDAAECVVIFLSKNFTEGFLDETGEHANCRSNEKNGLMMECITVLEIIEIEKRIQRAKKKGEDFRVITVNIDGYQLTIEDQLTLEKVFKDQNIYENDSVSHFAQQNINAFFPARDDEKSFFEALAPSVFSSKHYRNEAIKGNFSFLGIPTSVDIILLDAVRHISLKDFSFLQCSNRLVLDFYEQIRNAGADIQHEIQNDTMISVVKFDCYLTDDEEKRKVRIYYKPIDYKLFFKTIQLWDSSPRFNMSEHLVRYDSEKPGADIYDIPNAIGLAFMVVTNDHKLVFSRRSLKRRIRSGEYDCTIVEGMKPDKIESEDYLEQECRRAFREEVCADDEGIEILVNGVILDKQYGQWNIIGTIFTPKTSEQLKILHPRREDTFEQNQLDFVEYMLPSGKKNIEALQLKLKEYSRCGLWGTALAVLYATMLNLGFSEHDLSDF